jgi:hypothetical protein
VPNINNLERDIASLPIQGPLQPFKSILETYRDTITIDTP